jgi:hypothetical protein
MVVRRMMPRMIEEVWENVVVVVVVVLFSLEVKGCE